jgi:hypothetical protein
MEEYAMTENERTDREIALDDATAALLRAAHVFGPGVVAWLAGSAYAYMATDEGRAEFSEFTEQINSPVASFLRELHQTSDAP